mgnify:CR=1 FL=1
MLFLFIMKRLKKKKSLGSYDYPRVSVFRSNNHIYAQVIDDNRSNTIIACSTIESSIKKEIINTSNKSAAFFVGKVLANRLKEKNINRIQFDRGLYKYHGRVAALAEGLREEGINV